MNTFKMEKKNKKVYVTFGLIIYVLGILSIFNTFSIAKKAGRTVEGLEIFFIALVFVIGTINILKAFLTKVSISEDKITFSSGVLPTKTVKKDEIAAIYRPYNNKFVIYKKNGKKVTINYIFDNLREFHNKLKKLNVYITPSKQKALNKVNK